MITIIKKRRHYEEDKRHYYEEGLEGDSLHDNNKGDNWVDDEEVEDLQEEDEEDPDLIPIRDLFETANKLYPNNDDKWEGIQLSQAQAQIASNIASSTRPHFSDHRAVNYQTRYTADLNSVESELVDVFGDSRDYD